MPDREPTDLPGYRLRELERRVESLDKKVNWLIGLAVASAFTVSGSILLLALALLARQ